MSWRFRTQKKTSLIHRQMSHREIPQDHRGIGTKRQSCADPRGLRSGCRKSKRQPLTLAMSSQPTKRQAPMRTTKPCPSSLEKLRRVSRECHGRTQSKCFRSIALKIAGFGIGRMMSGHAVTVFPRQVLDQSAAGHRCFCWPCVVLPPRTV